jgi:hypothetical protein
MRRERFVQRHRESITIVEGYFDLKYVENCASAFGLMSRVPEGFRFPFFMGISLLGWRRTIQGDQKVSGGWPSGTKWITSIFLAVMSRMADASDS